MQELDKQAENKPLRNEKGQLLPGNTANPNGRPKGSSLKEFQAEEFRNMTPEEKREWLSDVAKDTKWKMAEGNPKNDDSLDVKGDLIISIAEAIHNKYADTTSSSTK